MEIYNYGGFESGLGEEWIDRTLDTVIHSGCSITEGQNIEIVVVRGFKPMYRGRHIACRGDHDGLSVEFEWDWSRFTNHEGVSGEDVIRRGDGKYRGSKWVDESIFFLVLSRL